MPRLPLLQLHTTTYLGMMLVPKRSLMIALLLVANVASASAESDSQVRSVYEPGSLGTGNLGVRAGFAVADGAPGPGVELFLGLGRFDLSVGASAMPITIFGETNTVAYVSLAGQALLHEWGTTRLSARTMVADEVTDPSRAHVTNELRLTAGSARRRVLIGGGASIEHKPNGDWDTALLGHLGVELLSRSSVGVTLLAVLIAETNDVTPLASLNLTFQ